MSRPYHRVVLPRTLMVWYRDDAAERLELLWADMSKVPDDSDGYRTMRSLVDGLVRQIEYWNKMAQDGRRHSYLYGLEEARKNALGQWERVGEVTYSRPPIQGLARFVRGPFSFWSSPAAEGSARSAPPGAGRDLYVPVTRKVSLKNETAGQGGASL